MFNSEDETVFVHERERDEWISKRAYSLYAAGSEGRHVEHWEAVIDFKEKETLTGKTLQTGWRARSSGRRAPQQRPPGGRCPVRATFCLASGATPEPTSFNWRDDDRIASGSGALLPWCQTY